MRSKSNSAPHSTQRCSEVDPAWSCELPGNFFRIGNWESIPANLDGFGTPPPPPRPCVLFFIQRGLKKVPAGRFQNWAGGGGSFGGEGFLRNDMRMKVDHAARRGSETERLMHRQSISIWEWTYLSKISTDRFSTERNCIPSFGS